MNQPEKKFQIVINDDWEKWINKKPIEMSIGKQYSLDEMNDILTFLKIKQGTLIKVFQSNNEINLICSGKQYKNQQEDRNQKLISQQNFNKSQPLCTFNLEFSIIKEHSENQYKQEKTSQINKEENFILSNKILSLEFIYIKHSYQCIASELKFIFNRNFRFLQENQKLLIKLINHQYEKDQIILKPLDYLQFIKSTLSFDFLYYGLESNKEPQAKKYKRELKKKFDNIVQKTRSIFQIPSSKKKYKKKRKSKFRLSLQNQIENTKSDQKLSNQSDSLPFEHQDEEDSNFQPFCKKMKI